MDLSEGLVSNDKHTLQMAVEVQQRFHPQVVLLGIAADDSRHTAPMSKEMNADGKAKRSTFACISCHSMKQKCNPTDKDDIYRHPCIRCAKLNKTCQFDLSKRRRRKKKKKLGGTHPHEIGGTANDASQEGVLKLGTNSVVMADDDTSSSSTKTVSPYTSISSLEHGQRHGHGHGNGNGNTHGQRHGQRQRLGSTGDEPTNFPLSYSLPTTYSLGTANTAVAPAPAFKMKQPLASTAAWQYPPQQPSLSQHQRLLPKPWLEADLKRLEGANLSHLQRSYPGNMVTVQQNDLNGSHSSTLLGQNALSVPTDDSIGNIAYNTRAETSHLLHINQINSHQPLSSGSPPHTLKIISPNLPAKNNCFVNNQTGKLDGNGTPTNNCNPSPVFSGPGGEFNDYELEITNLLSWQKGALESAAAKLQSLAIDWDGMVQTTSAVPLYTDPLALGLISEREALYYLKLYRETMSKKFHLPLVKIPDHMTIDELRKTQPILFSTILAVVSLIVPASHKSSTNKLKLDNFALSMICHHGMRLGSRSSELIRSLLVLCLWYNFAEWNNQTRYHYFNYICCTAIRDFDLNGNHKLMALMDGAQQNMIPEKRNSEYDDEFYHMVLVIYVSGLNISIFLRQPIQLRWSAKFDAFCDGLLKGKYPSKIYDHEDDKIFVVFAKINHCLELIHTHIQLTSGTMETTYITFDNDAFMKKMINMLDGLYPDISQEKYRILAFYNSVYAYLYESILIDFFQPKTMEDKFELQELPEHVEDAFKNCLAKCLATFNYFFKLTPDLIASMPLFHVTRIIYVLGVLLLKIRFGAMTIPAIQHLRPLTDPCIDILKNMCGILDETSRLYPQNSFLLKLRYVCALFSQTYATNIRKYLETKNTNPGLDFNALFQSGNVSSFFVDSMILENSINSLNDQFWTDMLTNLL
ncbi:unnamed protein product [Kluyveromyces dobzhanskii CBS 2104]|uniref:WGS project CCBQ000000000 data, contig 00016 n=1 Tax=Kluyveromyces dobzhanskii CBS 2104 TaxID=1427455 RepID=A0A0A8L210_9SACH|nr:unnamed protein product [Kluyveromyces dobzhanskii CBS 2104]